MTAVGTGSSPVFVVGLPRSGTTLMAVCLDRHPDLDCGPETHLFPTLDAVADRALLDASTWPDAATDFVCSLATRGVPIHETVGVSRDVIRAQLAGRTPSVAALLEALVVPQAEAAGTSRWVEKTPRHQDYLALIRAEWPDAAIIHMVRDPRSRAVSMTRMPFGPATQVLNLVEDARRDGSARSALDADPRLLQVRLEDLVADPEGELRRICAFIGAAFDPVMLEPSGSSAVGDQEWWKSGAQGTISGDGSSQWQAAMEPAVQRFAALTCADQLRRYGYPGARVARQTMVVLPIGRDVIATHEPLPLALALHDGVIDSADAGTSSGVGRADAVVLWGRPGQLLPLDAGTPIGWRGVARLTGALALRRLRRRPVWWVTQWTEHPRDAARAQERVFARALRVLARQVTAAALVERYRDTAPGDAGPQSSAE